MLLSLSNDEQASNPRAASGGTEGRQRDAYVNRTQIDSKAEESEMCRRLSIEFQAAHPEEKKKKEKPEKGEPSKPATNTAQWGQQQLRICGAAITRTGQVFKRRESSHFSSQVAFVLTFWHGNPLSPRFLTLISFIQQF
jgi:hypothetical protein